ncbi:MAG: 1-acyl-sn-glycerol-3-phosphate acyltransferase [Acidobacteriota bacterium]
MSAATPLSPIFVLGGHDEVTDRLVDRLGPRAVVHRDALDADVDAALAANRPALAVVLATSRLTADGLPDLDDADTLLDVLARAGVPRLVVAASSQVFEPDCRHPAMVDETWGTTLREGHAPLAVAWSALERAFGVEDEASDAAAGSTPEPRVALLRAAPVLDPRGRDVLPRLLTGRRAVVSAGFDPTLQLLDPDDLVGALMRVIESDEDGVFHVAPAGGVPLRAMLRLAGVARWGGPGPMQGAMRLLDSAAARELSRLAAPYLRYSFTVKGRRLATMGWQPRWRADEAIRRFCLPDVDGKARRAPSVAEPHDGYDDFGMDRGYIDAKSRGLFGFLHDRYWRIETRGVEHVPREGPVVLVGIHRGHQPYDGVMLLHLLATRIGRYPRFLIHPSLTKPAFLSDFMTKLGGVLASQANADHLLARGRPLALFPEGIQGAFVPYREAYTLRRFGRHDYVRMALRHRAPIVPFVTVGSAEIFPILAKIHWPAFERHTLWPCLPITPTMSTVPLPSKWHTQILPSIDLTTSYGPEAADDARTVRTIGKEIKALMNDRLQAMVAQRKHRFWGSIWDAAPEETAEIVP